MRLPIDVPGHGEAGGLQYNRHKQITRTWT